MSPRISYQVRLVWILGFNTLLLILIFIGIKELLSGRRTFVFLTTALVLTILAIFIFLEISVRKYNLNDIESDSIATQSPHRKLLEQRLYEIPSHPFSVNEFLIELDDYYKQGLTRSINRTRASTDFNGTYIKIADGIRCGIAPAANIEKKIFVLGGSTVSCLEGPDEWTLPSRIQHQLNCFKIPKGVINLGVSGATTFDRFTAARDQKSITPGDTLFFWFGVNEGKGLWGRKGRGILGFWPGFVEFFALLRKYSKSTILNWLYLELVKFDQKSHRRLARTRASELRKRFDIENRNWAERDVKLIAGLQPTIFSALSNITIREFLSKNWKPEMITIMNIQYEEFRLSFSGAKYFIDFSNSTPMDSEEAFVDWAHLSWRGNEIVAGDICRSGIFADNQRFNKL